MKRAVAFVGVSDEGGRGDDMMSPAIQLAAIRAHCKRSGYRIVRTIERIDVSGSNRAGRDYAEAVELIEARQADVIVVWKWSRLARNRYAWAVAVDRIESAGGQLESATEATDVSTSAGKLSRGILAEFAAFESDRIGEAWRETHRQRFDAGLSPNSRPPFGWRKAGRGIEPDPPRAAAVVQMYDLYLGGLGFIQLAAWLNASPLPPARAGLWHPTTAKSVLDNPTHAGFVTYRRERGPGAHDGIITPELFARYEATRRDGRRVGRRERSAYLLSGLLRCAVCGYAMTGQPPARYVCRYAAVTGAHRHQSVSVARVDAAVLDWLAGVAGPVNAAAQSVTVTPAPAAVPDDLAARLGVLDRKLARLLLVDDAMPAEAYRLARDELTGQRAALVAALTAAADRAALAAPVPRQAAFDLLADFDLLTVQAQRAGLRALIDRVVVTLGPDFAVEVVSK